MLSHLLIATTNPGKLREIREVLDDLPLALETLADRPGIAEPEEDGATFAENARLKALHYAAATGRPVVAEDSGLAIDALDGEPGVRSARYEGATYPDKFRNLFAALDRRAARDSGARFVCALAVADGPRILFEAEGVVEGRITREPHGENGFGYDPMFLPDGHALTFGEMTNVEKHGLPPAGKGLSHRARAFLKLAEACLARP